MFDISYIRVIYDRFNVSLISLHNVKRVDIYKVNDLYFTVKFVYTDDSTNALKLPMKTYDEFVEFLLSRIEGNGMVISLPELAEGD